MSPTLHHESTRVPVTALASSGAFLIVAEGPFLRFYDAKSSRYIVSRRVFKAQAVHGISVYAEDHDDVTKLVVWGGRLVRALSINLVAHDHGYEPLSMCLSNVAKASDWILDLAPQMSSLEDQDVYNQGTCAAVTAHNALLELTIRYQEASTPLSSVLTLDISELTASSRSILYSAHILWDSFNSILVAAGTAFGEIMYWSWIKPAQSEAFSQIHQVFLGHEGSIFDVRISKELQRGCCGSLKRVIASCSDDRTVRLWDVSNVDIHATNVHAIDEGAGAQRTRHTGFSIAATDTQSDDSNCLAIGWGHTSRVWKVRFLDALPCDGALTVLSAGEDATSRTWKLVANTGKDGSQPSVLVQTDCATYHNGKNMWSMATYRPTAGPLRVACGAADSKITTHPLLGVEQSTLGTSAAEYTVQDLFHMAWPPPAVEDVRKPIKSSKKADSVRSYCFLDNESFLLVTNFGAILLESFQSNSSSGPQNSLTMSTVVDQLDDLSGYSTCTSVPKYGLAFIAGKLGNIYMYSKRDSMLKKIHTVTGKVGNLSVTETTSSEEQQQLVLLIILVGVKEDQLLYIDIATNLTPGDLKTTYVNISDTLTRPTVTSMSVVETGPRISVLLLGFRRGSVELFDISRDVDNEARSYKIIEKVHGDEAVTALKFVASTRSATTGYLYSVGRDGCLAVHSIDLIKNIVQLVHNLTLPIGPYIEGLCFQDGHLLVHGFSSKKWVLYDVTSEEECMGIETGGAHRSWAFQPNFTPLSQQYGGTLVWTRTASLHICSQEGSNHGVLRPGGHGREIKAVAVSPADESSECRVGHCTLIATGAEDTDIRIFQYINGEPVCRRTLRKHTTGIQHLQWSDDGNYLFSSAGSEEFYIWRIRSLPTTIDIGVVCEYVYTPESEFSDLRIMSFDVMRRGSAYTIAMVFSDSSVKTYCYNPTVATKWQPLAKGVYFTSCLTQSKFLSSTTLLTTGTDGHAVLWPLSTSPTEPSTQTLNWQYPIKIHQNASKTMSSLTNADGTTLIVSGGDDGAVAFLLARPAGKDSSSSSAAPHEPYVSPPILVAGAHGSAVTACTIVAIQSHVYVLTSGNDEWIRLWEVTTSDDIADSGSNKAGSDKLTIERMSRVKTNVADVSSMVVLDSDGKTGARVLVCGVGMEVIRLNMSPSSGES